MKNSNSFGVKSLLFFLAGIPTGFFVLSGLLDELITLGELTTIIERMINSAAIAEILGSIILLGLPFFVLALIISLIWSKIKISQSIFISVPLTAFLLLVVTFSDGSNVWYYDILLRFGMVLSPAGGFWLGYKTIHKIFTGLK